MTRHAAGPWGRSNEYTDEPDATGDYLVRFQDGRAMVLYYEISDYAVGISGGWYIDTYHENGDYDDTVRFDVPACGIDAWAKIVWPGEAVSK